MLFALTYFVSLRISKNGKMLKVNFSVFINKKWTDVSCYGSI